MVFNEKDQKRRVEHFSFKFFCSKGAYSENVYKNDCDFPKKYFSKTYKEGFVFLAQFPSVGPYRVPVSTIY